LRQIRLTYDQIEQICSRETRQELLQADRFWELSVTASMLVTMNKIAMISVTRFATE